jgi:hypothetical protein
MSVHSYLLQSAPVRSSFAPVKSTTGANAQKQWVCSSAPVAPVPYRTGTGDWSSFVQMNWSRENSPLGKRTIDHSTVSTLGFGGRVQELFRDRLSHLKTRNRLKGHLIPLERVFERVTNINSWQENSMPCQRPANQLLNLSSPFRFFLAERTVYETQLALWRCTRERLVRNSIAYHHQNHGSAGASTSQIGSSLELGHWLRFIRPCSLHPVIASTQSASGNEGRHRNKWVPVSCVAVCGGVEPRCFGLYKILK